MINKDEFAKRLAITMDATNMVSKAWTEAVLQTLEKYFEEGQEVKFTGFGAFEVKMMKERIGTNPLNGEKIRIPAHKRVSFKMGKNLKERLG